MALGSTRQFHRVESKKTVPNEQAPLSHRAPASKRAHLDRFTIVQRLGEGTMGVVYEAIDRHSGARVALKTLNHASPAALYHLKNEFRALTDVVHPNLVTLHELIVDRSAQLFTMELVHGVPFDDYVRVGFHERISAEPPPPGEHLDSRTRATLHEVPAAGAEPPVDFCRLVRALQQLAAGIEALHQAGKLHRDLKPSNVLVTACGGVKILDFGLVSDGATEPIGQTMGGKIAGTPVYMSPEQAAGEWATAASDWYAFGVVIYEALTGRVPFDGPIYDVLADKQRQVPKPPSRYVQVPQAIEALCMDLLSIDPSHRPTGSAVIARLAQLREPDTTPNDSSMPPAAATSAVSGIRPASPFVGREAELQLLHEALKATALGTPQVVRIAGASGMGKSALISTFAEGVSADPRSVVLRGRCYERESVPYKGIDGIIDALSRHLRRIRQRDVLRVLPRNVHVLCRVFPVLARVDSIMASAPRAADLPIDPSEQRRLAWGALRDLLGRVADSTPLLLCIDDFQWADRDSAQLLASLFAPPDPPPLMLLLSHRDEVIDDHSALTTLLAALEQHPVTLHEIRLQGLGPEHVTELIAACTLGPHALDAHTCSRESEGNPFLIHELLRQAQRHALSGNHDRNELDLDTVLRARVDALSDATQRVLKVVALAARPTSLDVLARATKVIDVRACTRKLQAENLVRTSTKDPNFVEIYHDRLRDAVVHNLAAEEQQALHAQLAEALFAHDGDPETLTEHYLGARDNVRALAQALRAAPRAERALSFDRAARFYRLAIELSRQIQPQDVHHLQLQLAESLAHAGRCLEAAAAYDSAAEGAPDEAIERLHLLAATQLLLAGRADEGLQRLDRALSAYGVPAFRDEAHATEHITHTLVAYTALCDRLEPCIAWRAAADLSIEEHTRLDVLHSAAIGLAWLDMGSRYFALALEDAKASVESREPLRVLCSGALLGSLFDSLGSELPPSAASLVAQASALVDDPRGRAWADYARGASAYFRSRFHEACDALGEAEEAFRNRCRGAARESVIVRIPLLISLRWSGRLDDVMRHCERWESAARQQGDVFTELWMQLLDIAPLCGDASLQARDRIEDSISKLATFVSHAASPSSAAVVRLIGQVRRAEVDWYDGRNDSAYEHVRVLWSERRGDSATLLQGEESAMRLPLHSMQLVWHRARAFCGLLGARGALDSALRTELQELVAQHDAFSIPTMTTPAMLYAAVALAADDRREAVRLLHEEARYAETVHRNLERAACLRLQAGRILGGSDGSALCESADAYLRRIGVRNPSRWAKVIAPGF